mgnify:FL=1
MNLLDTIMKDVVMAEVYESVHPLILLDLTPACEPIHQISDLSGLHFDQTLFLNGMLTFSSNRYTSAQETARFLQNNLLKINQEYEQFAHRIRLEKMRALAAIMSQFRETNLELTKLFAAHGLYNASGILKIDTVDASDMSCAVARMENRRWTQDFNPKATYSISGTSLEYLGQILLSV